MIRPTCMLIADHATVTHDGKLCIVGAFDTTSYERPKTAPPSQTITVHMAHAFLAAQLEFSIADGMTHPASIEVWDEDNLAIASLVIQTLELKLNPFGRPIRHNVIVQIGGLPLPGAGDYTFHLMLSGKSVGEIGFSVTELP